MIKHPLHYIGGALFAAGAFTAGVLSSASDHAEPTESQPIRVLRCVNEDVVVFHEPIDSMPDLRTDRTYLSRGRGHTQVEGLCATALCHPGDVREICEVVNGLE